MSAPSVRSRPTEPEAAPASPPDLEAPDFEEDLSARLWQNYVERIESMLEPLRPAARKEIAQELKVHLLESIRHDDAEQESVRVLNATEKLGRPEEYLKPIVTDRIIEEGATTYNPLPVVKGLGRTLTRGLKEMLSGLLFGVGYLLVLALASVAVLKPFFPQHVGLFYEPGADVDHRVVFGILDQTAGMTEVFGYWVIPLSLGAAALLYMALTKMLVLLRHSD